MSVNRTHVLKVRMSEQETALLQETADYFELSVSQLVRDAIRRHCVYLQHGPQPFPQALRQEHVGRGRR